MCGECTVENYTYNGSKDVLRRLFSPFKDLFILLTLSTRLKRFNKKVLRL